MRESSIAAIPADGIGPEVIAAGQTVLANLEMRLGDVKFTFENFNWGSDYYRKHGVMMPSDGLEQLKKFDAICFGAVGARRRHPHHALRLQVGPIPAAQAAHGRYEVQCPAAWHGHVGRDRL